MNTVKEYVAEKLNEADGQWFESLQLIASDAMHTKERSIKFYAECIIELRTACNIEKIREFQD